MATVVRRTFAERAGRSGYEYQRDPKSAAILFNAIVFVGDGAAVATWALRLPKFRLWCACDGARCLFKQCSHGRDGAVPRRRPSDPDCANCANPTEFWPAVAATRKRLRLRLR